LDHRGQQHVKNITRPIRAYAMRMDSSRVGLMKPVQRFRRSAFLAVAVLVILLGGAATWVHLRSANRASVARMALPLPDKPSIAVLPFDNLSADPEQGYFVDGITDDLITDLSKLSGIFVIARNSTLPYKGKAAKPQKVAEDLGVRYVL